jgi:cellulose synthase/poly-beta-1,6-N-acetylglucosamine synthase-like glycosyltransferase/spore germination protein YaaH/peptidoglycan/xylan/chitin deacetylase (PgdA/CDA1 family)
MLEVSGIVLATVAVVFFVSVVLTIPTLPSIIPRWSHPELRAGPGPRSRAKAPARRQGRQKRVEALGKIPASYDPLRMGFYVSWDFTSLSSLKLHYRELDVLVPEKLHAVDSSGHMTIEPDKNLDDWLKTLDVTIPTMPLVNNYDGVNWRTEEMVAFLSKPASRQRLIGDLVRYTNAYKQDGIVLDFELIPSESQRNFRDFVKELTDAAHLYNKKVMVCLPAADSDYDYAYFGKNSDAVILMNYDEHWVTSGPGPITSQEWYLRNLKNTLVDVPADKLIMGIANYSYDWPLTKDKKKAVATSTSFQQALVTAQESDTKVWFDEDALNPTFSYFDENSIEHQVWLLDAVTAYNEMRAAERLGVRGTALWRLGSEDPSIWPIWDATRPDAAMREKIKDMPPGYDLVLEGEGDIWRIADTPKHGRRDFDYDPATDTFTDESYPTPPFPYRIEQIGVPGKGICLSFDDGPDPRYTPEILDILKAKHAIATFFVTGANANESPQLLDRIYREGHEIGNHTYTHPRFDEIPLAQLRLELTLTQRLFESRLGIKTLLFRPPYGIDHHPESDNDVKLLPIPQSYGYLLIGSRIDPKDWGEIGGGPPPNAATIVERVIDQAEAGKGLIHIVLLHDGGGNRAQTVAALPGIIDGLRAHGFTLTGVSAQLGENRAQVMPVLQTSERWTARADALVFDSIHALRVLFATVFLAGIALISGRALFIGILALLEKLRPNPGEHPDFKPEVSVFIPAYNEELSIVETVQSVLDSDYPHLEVIVVDDGSHDRTGELLEGHFAADARVHILHQSNQGKPAALNRALAQATGEILVTIDADTYVEPDAISKLVRNFIDPTVGAVAGNTKVGNRHLWLTRWQALEYISSQNMEKRAFDLLDCITVVPGAIGAWRATAMRECGGFSRDTVAEDTDLTFAIRRRHWHIRYDDEAIAHTNAPETAAELIRQRFRWTFGTMQSAWKHRDTLGRARYGTLGWIAIPNVFLFQIVLPLFSPVIDLLFLSTVLIWGIAQLPIAEKLPQIWTGNDVRRSLLFFLAFMVVDFLTCVVAFALEKNEDWTLLFPIVLQRFYYRQMMYVVLFRALVRAVQGRAVGWGHATPKPRKA